MSTLKSKGRHPKNNGYPKILGYPKIDDGPLPGKEAPLSQILLYRGLIKVFL
jgi:hypothetical protein